MSILAIKTYSSIIREIRARKFSPIYFLMGEETYFIDKISKELDNVVLRDEEKILNRVVLYGNENKVEEVLMEAESYSLLSEYKIIFVKKAQNFSNSIDKFKNYFKNPIRSNILVFEYTGKRLDKRKSIYKNMESNCVFFDSKKLYDNQIDNWVKEELASINISISPKASTLLVHHLGNSLTRIDEELKKILIVENSISEITESHIEKYIGISRVYNNFELQNAIGKKELDKALFILNQFSKNPKANPLALILPSLFQYFIKIAKVHVSEFKTEFELSKKLAIRQYFVKDYLLAANNISLKAALTSLRYIRDADKTYKGIDKQKISEYDIIRVLIIKILSQ